MKLDAFTRWQLADYAAHDDVCGTSATHPGHCPATCVCWCHYWTPTQADEARRETVR